MGSCKSWTDAGVPSEDCGTNTTLLDARGWLYKSSSGARITSLGGLDCATRGWSSVLIDCASNLRTTCRPSSSDSVSLSQDHRNARNHCARRRLLTGPGLVASPIWTPRNPYLAFSLKNQRFMTPETTLSSEQTAPRQELPATRTRRLSFLADASTESTARHLVPSLTSIREPQHRPPWQKTSRTRRRRAS